MRFTFLSHFKLNGKSIYKYINKETGIAKVSEISIENNWSKMKECVYSESDSYFEFKGNKFYSINTILEIMQ